jgi:UPF0271 protein
MVKQIDLNCDMGESFGAYTFGADEQLLAFVTSANIACGSHAGEPNVMDQTVRWAKQHHVAVGAHPGFPDIAGFGRRVIELSPDEIYRLVIYQVGALQAFCKIHKVTMQHVKPHGALYNIAAQDRDVAEAIAGAVYDLDNSLMLYGLAGGELIVAGRDAGLRVVSEVFADRTYQADGSLTSRKHDNAMINDLNVAVAQVKRMVSDGVVEAVNGKLVPIEADTVCVHGDGPHAVSFAKQLRLALEAAHINVKAIR